MKIIKLLTVPFLILAFSASITAQVQERKLLIDGAPVGEVDTYSYGNGLYLNMVHLVRQLGCKADFLQASGKAVITVKKGRMIFDENSNIVYTGSTKKQYNQPLIIRAGIPFVLADCFSSQEFNQLYGHNISVVGLKAKKSLDYTPIEQVSNKRIVPVSTELKVEAAQVPVIASSNDKKNKKYTNEKIEKNTEIISKKNEEIAPVPEVDKKAEKQIHAGVEAKITKTETSEYVAQLISVRCSAYKDRTRIVMNVSQPLSWTEQMFDNLLIISIPGAKANISAPENLSGKEISGINILQKKGQAEVRISLSKLSGITDIFRLTSPDRIVADIYSLGIKDIDQKIDEKPVSTDKDNVSGQAITAKDEKVLDNVMAGLKASGLEYDVEEDKKPLAASPAAMPALGAIPAKTHINSKRKRIIVLDAGHGGKDFGGKKRFGLSEKQLNLIIAKEVQGIFEGNTQFQAVLTRAEDDYLTLSERSRLANEEKADLFISIHANSSSDSSLNGFEVYSFSNEPSDNTAKNTAYIENGGDKLNDSLLPEQMNIYSSGGRLAEFIAKELERGTALKNNGVKKAGFKLLKDIKTPSALIELGYMTSSNDKQLLDDKSSRSQIAVSIYKGILSYAQMQGWIK